MSRFEFPRARGGRGPQIGPGTFEARTAVVPPGIRPPRFEAIVWAPGPGVPSIELWCFHVGEFETIDNTVGSMASLFLDSVAAGEEFVPPSGAQPQSLITCEDLIDYSRSRYFAKYDDLTQPADWAVQTMLPFPSPMGASSLKFFDGFYQVAQPDRPTGDAALAWVFVRNGGSEEFWLFHHENEIDGFHLPGTQPDGASGLYAATELRCTSLADPTTIPPGATSAKVITELKKEIAGLPGTPVVDPDIDLTYHDFRVRDVPV